MRRKLREKYLRFKHQKLGVPRFRVLGTDCFITSWPRSGNTWMRYLVFAALHPEREWDLVSIEQQMPAVDRLDFPKVLAAMPEHSHRLFKSHDPFQPYVLAGKTVYLVRDGRDAILSFYHYQSELSRRKTTWERFLRDSLAGRHDYGAWHTHVAGWLAHENHPNVLIVRYEDMLEDAERELRRVLAHIGVSVPCDRITAAALRSSVDSVNRGFQRYAANRGKQFSGGLGGGSGRWRTAYGEADQRLFESYAGDVMRLIPGGKADRSILGAAQK